MQLRYRVEPFRGADRGKSGSGFKEPIDVGIYKAKLRFGALNADSEKFDELAVSLLMERHWIWTVLVLFLGVVLSWLSTQGIETLGERGELSRRILKHSQN